MSRNNPSFGLGHGIQTVEPEVHSKLNVTELKAADSVKEFDIHNHALAWSLAEPIVMDSTDDIKSKVNWQGRVEPFLHQIKNLMTFCRKLPVTLIADDVGLGKTISAGLILSELMIRNRVSRVLVICPSLLGPQWIEELDSKFGIKGTWATGAKLNDELKGIYPVVATTYQTASSRLKRIEPGAFDMLILDEAHKVRNLYGGNSKPQFAKNIRQALSDRLFRYVVMLTATPIQNRLWDLYSLIDCLAVAKGHENPFGSEENFNSKFIADSKATARELNPARADEFRGILRQYLVRTRRQEVQLLFPEREVKLFQVKQNDLDKELQELVSNHIDGINGLLKSSILVAMMSSPQALAAQLRNMSIKNSTWESLALQVERLTATSGNPSKLNGLLNIIAQLKRSRPKDWRLVVFTTRKETQNKIISCLLEQDISCGVIKGGNANKNQKTVKDYSATPPRIHVIVSTDAGAEGVNLQAGNVVVNYDLPWNPMIVEQRIGRVQRLASKHEHVVIVNLAVNGSPEQKVVTRLMEKLLTVSHSVGDVEAILEAAGGTGKDGETSFEHTIRDLVIKSLKGQNIDQATQLATKSIEDAKELFESQRADLDSKLGNLGELHESGPSMPKLESITPEVSYIEFVKMALEAEGYELNSDQNGILRATKNGFPTERIVFTAKEWEQHSQPGLFHGRSPKLYLPGKPDFERLVQRWLDRGQHLTRDLRDLTQPLVTELAEQWLKKFESASLEAVSVLNSEPYWQGETKLKVTATNAVDSYETLATVAHARGEHHQLTEENYEKSLLVRKRLRADSSTSTFHGECTSAVENHSGISEFSKFYSARLAEEIQQARRNPELTKKIETDLNPSVHAETVSQKGYLYEKCEIQIDYQLDGFSGYSSLLSVCPVTDQIFTEPDFSSRCESTGQLFPAECLEKCERSEKHVLKHLLVASDESGRKALSEYACICELTGKVVLDDEQLTSVVSGKTGLASSFQFSPISNRPALPEEFVVCDFSGESVLPDEVMISEVSQQPFRIDQKGFSSVSGTIGHESEFVTCAMTGEILLPDEAILSDVSQCYVRRDHAAKSTKSPFRQGTLNELVVCESTGKELLIDEVAECSVTKKKVDHSLLAQSDFSLKLALPDELLVCDITGQQLLPDETGASVVSGKQVRLDLLVRSEIDRELALPEEFLTCEVTQTKCLATELLTSEFSGKKFRRDQMVKSSASGRIGHDSESIICAATGKPILNDETGISACSGKIVSQSLLVKSDFSERFALADEMEICDFTQQKGLHDEFSQSDVSGKKFYKQEHIFSEISGRVGHTSEAAVCEFSSKEVLIDELVITSVSQIIVAKNYAMQSPVSQEWALENEFVHCEITGDMVLPSDLIESYDSKKKFRKDQSVQSSHTNHICHISESTLCESTQEPFPNSEIVQSDYSAKNVARHLLITSEKSKRRGLESETAVCFESQQRLLLDELQKSVVSGELVDKELLVPSDRSGKQALSKELVECTVTHRKLLPDETVFCQDIQGFADNSLTAKSSISGWTVLRENLKKCSLTCAVGLASELVQCELTGTYVVKEKTAKCNVTGKIVRLDKLTRSDVSSRYLIPSEAYESIFSGLTLCPDEAVYCHWDEGYLAEREAGTCSLTGLTFGAQYLTKITKEVGIFRRIQQNANVKNFNELIPWVQNEMEGKFKSLKTLRGRKSKKGTFIFLEGVSKKFLGMVNEPFYFVIKTKPNMEIIGTVANEIS